MIHFFKCRLIWNKETLSTNFPQFLEEESDCESRENWKPIQYFNQYYNDLFFELAGRETNIYYHLKTGKILKTSANEIKKFVGITLLMSALGYPRIRLYWDSYFKIKLTSTALPRERYFILRQHIHVVNNMTDEQKRSDRLWKVRPVIKSFHDGVMKLRREQNVSVDEQMIPFTGHVGVRQYVPRKPNPTGLKNYILAGKGGLILDFKVYQGDTTRLPDEIQSNLKLGAGGRAVLRLSESCPPGTNIYFDRYFSSVALLEALQAKGISGTGTALTARFPNTNLKTDQQLLKEGRGAFDSKVRDDQQMLCMKWMDNKSVTVCSTVHGVQPIREVNRYSRAQRGFVKVQQPYAIKMYNANMGNVDLFNRLISYYRSNHKTKKWTVRFFEHFMDKACVNSWLLYRNDCINLQKRNTEILDLHYFKMQIARKLIHGYSTNQNVESDSTESVANDEPPRKKSVGRPGYEFRRKKKERCVLHTYLKL